MLGGGGGVATDNHDKNLTFLIKRHQALIDHCVLKRVPEGCEFL